MECKMKSRFLVGVPAFALAAAVVICSAAQASAHRWHRVRAHYGYSHSYYPTYAYGPGFVYAPDYAALVAGLAYSASYANRPYPFYRRLWY
jgi:chitodextrinase